MIARVIHWSVHNRLLVLIATLGITVWGAWSAWQTPLDAIPDLSDVQVIVRTTYPGQAPQVVEDQVTYPLTTTMLSVPHAKSVRGYSMFGESLVYVLFEDGTDLYWARARVLEYLSQVLSRLPTGAVAALGPDATGVGWIYEYALVDRTGQHDVAELRAIQDWFLKDELKSVSNVAEIASLGGFVQQYQIVIDPDRLRSRGLTLPQVIDAVRQANAETGGSVLEMAEAEYVVRMRGYLQTLDDFRAVGLGADADGTPILLGDVATVRRGPALRRGIVELDGQGEVAGGVVVMRYGANPLDTIEAVKRKLNELRPGLPPGVEWVTTYDRSGLIERSIHHLGIKLLEEFAIVGLVCLIFLFHLRSALVAVLTLPVGILAAFIVLRHQGLNANIMSLGGIAIAIGAMIDAAVVMIENAHKRLEAWRHEHPNERLSPPERLRLIADAAAEVGPALFFCLLIITLSFIPVFTLQAQEGRLFAPLAYTKTYAMAAAAALSVTLIPVLMTLFIRGKLVDEANNPANRVLTAMYRPILAAVLHRPRTTLLVAAVAVAATTWPLSKLGSEFMPPLDEGDLLYMPTALPGLSAGKAAQLVQQADRLIKTLPEVETVFGKMGRAETATDPAPLTMMETTIRLKPRSQWRPGMTLDQLIDELDATVQIPGLSNVWVQPIRNRLDMLATGIKSPVGIKITGPDLRELERLGGEVEQVVRSVPGTLSAVAERTASGRYIDVEPDRQALARFGLNIADLQRIIGFAVGGGSIGEVVDGLARYPINIRYPRDRRDSLATLRDLPIALAHGGSVTLGQVARIEIVDGPPMIRSENARPASYVYVDLHGRDLGSYVADAQQAVRDQVTLPAGYSIGWSGQFEYLERARARLMFVVPATVLIIWLLLYLTFRSVGDALLLLATLPLSLVGGVWLIALLGHQLSVASVVGFIALAGVSAEFGVVMLLYIHHELEVIRAGQGTTTAGDDVIEAAITRGALHRVRPKAMTVAVIVAGLLPLFWGSGSGSAGGDMMLRIAAPMVGGMLSAPVLSMLVLPAAYLLLERWRMKGREQDA